MSSTKKYLIIPLLVLLVASCNHKSFTMEGTLENGANKTLYLEEMHPQGERLFIDSIRLDKRGHFSYKYKLPYETLLNLHATEYDYVVLIPQNGEHLKIKGDFNEFEKTYTVEGSPESSLLWQLQDYSNYGADRLKQIVSIYQDNVANIADPEELKKAKAYTDSLYVSAYKEQQSYVVQFINENKGSLATLIALYKPFNNTQLINPQVNLDYYELVLEGLMDEKPENPHTLQFKNTVEHLRFAVQGGNQKATSEMNLVFDGNDEKLNDDEETSEQ